MSREECQHVCAVVTVRAGPGGTTLSGRGSRIHPPRAEGALRLEEERALYVTTLNVLVTRVRDYYVRRGFPDALVRAQIRPGRAPTRAVLHFTVREGEQVSVDW